MKVGLLKLVTDDGFLHFSSVYFSLGKEATNENSFNNEKFLNLLTYKLNDISEIEFFIDDKKFKDIFGKDIHKQEEFIFQKSLFITIHIHDMKILGESQQLTTYYVVNFIVDKIAKTKNSNYILNFEIKTIDDKFKFSKVYENGIISNQLSLKIKEKTSNNK